MGELLGERMVLYVCWSAMVDRVCLAENVPGLDGGSGMGFPLEGLVDMRMWSD